MYVSLVISNKLMSNTNWKYPANVQINVAPIFGEVTEKLTDSDFYGNSTIINMNIYLPKYFKIRLISLQIVTSLSTINRNFILTHFSAAISF